MTVADQSSHSCSTHGSSCSCGGHHADPSPTQHSHGSCACGGHHHATTQSAPQATSEKKSCGCGRLKPFRKIHTLAGIAFALFILGHFAVLSTAWRPEAFSQNAQALHTLSSNIPAIEIVALLLPTAALIICGLYLLWNAGLRYNAKKCNRGGKLRFFLQRITALFILAFLAIHVLSFSSWGNKLFGLTSETATGFNSSNAIASATFSMRHPFGLLQTSTPLAIIMTSVYALGILALAYHFANGLWTAAVMWGFIPSDDCQQRWLKTCKIIGISLAALGLVALAAFIRH